MSDFYRSNGWIPLSMPDSRFAPGVIFSYDESSKQVRYVSSLKTCGVPVDVTAAVEGNSAKLTFSASSAYTADAVLKVKGVTAGPEFSKVKKTGLELQSHGGASMDLFKVQIWLSAPKNAKTFPDACKKGLDQPNIYLVQEAYVVRKGKYALHDATGASIAVRGLNIGPVSFEPNASGKASSDGTLEFDEPLVTAVRRVKRIDGGFLSLGSTTSAAYADDEILKLMAR